MSLIEHRRYRRGVFQIEQLAGLMPSLAGAPGLCPWDPHLLDAWALGLGAERSKSAFAARFVLNLWAPGVWSSGPFDLQNDWRTLGPGDLVVYELWAKNKFVPSSGYKTTPEMQELLDRTTDRFLATYYPNLDPEPDPPVGVLESTEDPLGSNYRLCGRDLFEGAEIEVFCSRSDWLRGFFSWSGRAFERPRLHVPLSDPTRRPPDGVGIGMMSAIIPERAACRWVETGELLF